MRKNNFKLNFTKNHQASWFSCRRLKISKFSISLTWLDKCSRNKVTSLICQCCFALFNEFTFHKKLHHISHQFIHAIIHVREHWAASLTFCPEQLENTTNKTEKLKFCDRKLVTDSLLGIQRAFQRKVANSLVMFPSN